MIRGGCAYGEHVKEDEPALAERSVRELAAVTDAHLCAEIRDAMAGVVAAVDAWLHSPGPALGYSDNELVTGTGTMQLSAAAITGNDAGAPRALEKAARPVLSGYLGERSEPAQAVRDAIDRLRQAAKIRPGLVRDCRLLVNKRQP